MSFASAVDEIVVGTRKERRRTEEEEGAKVVEEEERVGAGGMAFLRTARTFTHVKKGDKK